MDGAAENGSLGVVKWLHHNRQEGCTGDALFLAAKVIIIQHDRCLQYNCSCMLLLLLVDNFVVADKIRFRYLSRLLLLL